MPRYILSAGLGLVGFVLMLSFSFGSHASAAQKGKAPPPPPPPPVPKKAPGGPTRRTLPFPGTHFHGPYGGTNFHGLHGLSPLLRTGLMLPEFVASHCPTAHGIAHGANECALCHRDRHGVRGFGGGGATELFWWPAVAGGDPTRRLLNDMMIGGPMTAPGLRAHALLNHGLDPEVISFVSGRYRARAPGALNSFFALDDDFGPWGGNPLAHLDPGLRIGAFGPRSVPFPDVFGGLSPLDIAGPRSGVYRPLALPPLVMDHFWNSGFHRGFDPFGLDGFGLGGGFYLDGGGMLGRPAGLGIPGLRGPIGPFGGGFNPARIGMFQPPPRPRPAVREPSKEEQRTALEKFDKSLAGVETLARVGAWDVLGAGLEKTSAGGPSAVAVPLKGIQTEATRLDDLLRLRAAVTTTWTVAPDPAALARHVEALRALTGDAELADRVTRLLAVKALWEGHDPAAARICGAEAPDLDAELEALREPRAGDADRPKPIATDEDRAEACQPVVRELLGQLDRHLEYGRYSASVHLADVRAVRGGVSKAVKALNGTEVKRADDFEKIAADVSKALGRRLTETDRVVLRQMYAAKKTTEEMTAALR